MSEEMIDSYRIAASCSRLRLAAPRHTAVGRSGACGVRIAISQRMSTLAELALSLAHSGYLLILHLHQSACGPAAPFRNWLLVGSKIEGDEEQEVGTDDADSSNGGKLFTSTLAGIREPIPVGGGEVGPRSEVDETKIEHKLDDLHDGDVFLPPDADAARALEVVPVHDNMNHQVQGNDDPRNRSVADQLGVAEESSCAMVIGMQESQWLLLQEQEAGIDQFEEFGEVVEIVQNNQLVGPATLVVTDCEENAVPGNRWDQLLGEKHQQNEADGRQEEIVDLEQEVELEGWSVAHKLTPPEYYNVVG